MSSAGMRGRVGFEEESLVRVGNDVVPAGLCGGTVGSEVVLTVDLGAGATVTPTTVARDRPLLHSNIVTFSMRLRTAEFR